MYAICPVALLTITYSIPYLWQSKKGTLTHQVTAYDRWWSKVNKKLSERESSPQTFLLLPDCGKINLLHHLVRQLRLECSATNVSTVKLCSLSWGVGKGVSTENREIPQTHRFSADLALAPGSFFSAMFVRTRCKPYWYPVITNISLKKEPGENDGNCAKNGFAETL